MAAVRFFLSELKMAKKFPQIWHWASIKWLCNHTFGKLTIFKTAQIPAAQCSAHPSFAAAAFSCRWEELWHATQCAVFCAKLFLLFCFHCFRVQDGSRMVGERYAGFHLPGTLGKILQLHHHHYHHRHHHHHSHHHHHYHCWSIVITFHWGHCSRNSTKIVVGFHKNQSMWGWRAGEVFQRYASSYDEEDDGEVKVC